MAKVTIDTAKIIIIEGNDEESERVWPVIRIVYQGKHFDFSGESMASDVMGSFALCEFFAAITGLEYKEDGE